MRLSWSTANLPISPCLTDPGLHTTSGSLLDVQRCISALVSVDEPFSGRSRLEHRESERRIEPLQVYIHVQIVNIERASD